MPSIGYANSKQKVSAPAPSKPAPQPASPYRPVVTKNQYSTPVGPGQGIYGSKDVYRPASTSQGGSNSGAGGGGVQQFQNAPMEPQPDEPNIDFDALIAPALQALDEAIGPLQQGFSDYQSSQLSQQKTAQDSTNQQIGEQQGILTRKGEQQTNQANSAVDEARRLYSEIGQGIQSRYGGTTGTGAFATELAGSQTLRNIGNVRQQLSQSLGEIADKMQQVKEIGRIALQDIQDKTQERILQAKNQLESSLSAIRQQKGELQARKAEMAMNAMQTYQQTVQAVNARNAQFQQQLYVQQLNAQQSLQSALARGKSLADSQQLYNLTSGNLTTPVLYNKTQNTLSGVGGNQLPAYDTSNYILQVPGTTSTKKKEEYDPNAIPSDLSF